MVAHRSTHYTPRATLTVLGCALLLTSALACGPSTAVRARDDVQNRVARDSEAVEVELPEDASWLALASHGDLFYCLGQPVDASIVGSAERFLMAFDKRGEERWSLEFSLPTTAVPSYYADLVVGGDVLVFLTDYVFIGLSPVDGSILWTIDNQMASLRFVGIANGTLYASSYPTTIYAYSLADGTENGSWEFQGYAAAMEAWLSADGNSVVATVDMSGQLGVAALDVTTPTSTPREIMREPNPYEYQTTFVGPTRYSGTGMVNYDRSDFTAKIASTYERVMVDVWSIEGGDPILHREIPLDPDEYYASSYYAPRFLLGRTGGLLQEPMANGVLLSNVLRLHLHDLPSGERRWTNVLPTQHYIDSFMELDSGRMLIHTRTDSGEMTDCWYLFSAQGELLWSSSTTSEFAGQTRAIAATNEAVARLTTTNWTDSRLFVNTIAASSEAR